MVINVNFCLQVLAIIAALFGIVAAIVGFFDAGSFSAWVRNIFTLIFALALLIVELYVFSFFKYFGFLLKWWGKGAMYLFMGALLYAPRGFNLACAIIFWILAVVYIICSIFFHTVSAPIFQKNSQPDMSSNASDYYQQQT